MRSKDLSIAESRAIINMNEEHNFANVRNSTL